MWCLVLFLALFNTSVFKFQDTRLCTPSQCHLKSPPTALKSSLQVLVYYLHEISDIAEQPAAPSPPWPSLPPSGLPPSLLTPQLRNSQRGQETQRGGCCLWPTRHSLASFPLTAHKSKLLNICSQAGNGLGHTPCDFRPLFKGIIALLPSPMGTPASTLA